MTNNCDPGFATTFPPKYKLQSTILALVLLAVTIWTATHLDRLYQNLANIRLLRTTFEPITPELLRQSRELRNELLASPIAMPVGYRLTVYGRELLWRGEFQHAYDVFQRVVAISPNSSDGYYLGGLALARSGDAQTALEWLTKAIELDAFDPRFEVTLQEPDIWWPGRPDNASRTPSPSMSFVQMAAIYYGQKQWNHMIDMSHHAIEADASNPLGRLQLGVAYFRKAMDEGTKTANLLSLAKQTFLSVAPVVGNEQYPFFLYLARISIAQGDYEEAAKAYKSLAGTSPYVEHLHESAQFLMSARMTDDSIAVYEVILSRTSLTPDVVQLWIDAAAAYLSVSDNATACELIQEVVVLCSVNQCEVDNLLQEFNCPN